MFIYALQYSTTAYTGLMPVVAIPMNKPVFHKISGCHWHAIGYGGHRPLRLLRLSRLWMLSKTLRETLTRARWQHVSTHNYLTDGGIMTSLHVRLKWPILGTSSIFSQTRPNHIIVGPLKHYCIQSHEITSQPP